ncbi:MAG: prephenate dehydratase [Erysipelotrichaceae bacterium]|nr:prephenate dehydratase [Erysipelotrichaceae bacterium]
MKVGYQGVAGAFSEMAVRQYFKNQYFEEVTFSDFPEMFEAVDKEEVDYALFPVENTTTGIIARTYDLFQYYDVSVVGEVNVPIRENLIVLPGTDIDDIKEVYSHPEALSQCRSFFRKYPKMKPVVYEDTALSVRYIRELNDPSKAALASLRAAEVWQMKVLLESVQDNTMNMTRFFVVGKHPQEREDNDKISIRMVLSHTPGALYNALGLFASKRINVVKVESRPIIGKVFEYCFYLDFTGNMSDPDVRETLRRLEYDCLDLKILGNYRAAARP